LENSASLEVLILRGCQIENASPSINLVNLRELDLGINQISDKTAKLAFLALHNLEKLNIEYNQITDISVFSNLKKLKFLNLRNEYFITDISAISSLENLRELIFIIMVQLTCRHFSI
jgi:Leucine-rich repeat (LRR) protein